MSHPLQPLNCPNCAAPLPPGPTTSCPYCSTAFHQPAPPPAPTSPSATDRIAAELAIARLTPEIEQLRAEIDKLESTHSSQVGCGCLGLCLAIFGLILFVAAFSDPQISFWSSIIALVPGVWYARKGYLASRNHPAARQKQRLAQLQSDLKHARQTVRPNSPPPGA